MNFSSGAYLTASPRRGVDPRALFMQRTKVSGASPNFLGTLAHGMRLWLKAVGSRSRSQHSAVSRNQQDEITSRGIAVHRSAILNMCFSAKENSKSV